MSALPSGFMYSILCFCSRDLSALSCLQDKLVTEFLRRNEPIQSMPVECVPKWRLRLLLMSI